MPSIRILLLGLIKILIQIFSSCASSNFFAKGFSIRNSFYVIDIYDFQCGFFEPKIVHCMKRINRFSYWCQRTI